MDKIYKVHSHMNYRDVDYDAMLINQLFIISSVFKQKHMKQRYVLVDQLTKCDQRLTGM